MGSKGEPGSGLQLPSSPEPGARRSSVHPSGHTLRQDPGKALAHSSATEAISYRASDTTPMMMVSCSHRLSAFLWARNSGPHAGGFSGSDTTAARKSTLLRGSFGGNIQWSKACAAKLPEYTDCENCPGQWPGKSVEQPSLTRPDSTCTTASAQSPRGLWILHLAASVLQASAKGLKLTPTALVKLAMLAPGSYL